MTADIRHKDIAIIGAGPVGSLCALAHAQMGAKVALFEANQGHSNAIRGEWLHPPALRMLQQAGVRFGTEARATKGFVVFPEDSSEPIPLNYPEGSNGLVCSHETLVSRLRAAVANEPNITLIWQRAVPHLDGRVTYTENGEENSLIADRIVGAGGRSSAALRMFGLPTKPAVCSRMVGLRLGGVELPMEGYGHIFCGGPGPIFMYRSDEDSVSVIVDTPREYSGRRAIDLLLNSYTPHLPADMRGTFEEALNTRSLKFAGNLLKPRISYGNSRFTIIGDAAGHYHPMTAVGMTLGFRDAIALAESKSFDDFVATRFRETRAPEMLAMGLYEIFVDQRDETEALRHSVYRLWRKDNKLTVRSVRLLACEDTSETSLGFMGTVLIARAIARSLPRSMSLRAWRRTGSIVRQLAVRIGWFVVAVREIRRSRRSGEARSEQFRAALARAFLTSIPSPGPSERRTKS